MTLSGFLAYSAALAIAAAIPGPGVAALVSRALASGFLATFPMLLGLVLGDITYLVAVILGLSAIAQTFGMAFLVIKWLGVAYLIWLAWRFWTSGLRMQDFTSVAVGEPAIVSFMSGLTLTLGNPKTMVFYVAITPTIVDIRSVTFAETLVLVAITAAVLLVVLMPYLVLASRARGFLRAPRALRMMNRVAASFMAGAATAIAIRAN
jgi:threonine/homoserine/homoserine lactone efflux protein